MIRFVCKQFDYTNPRHLQEPGVTTMHTFTAVSELEAWLTEDTVKLNLERSFVGIEVIPACAAQRNEDERKEG